MESTISKHEIYLFKVLNFGAVQPFFWCRISSINDICAPFRKASTVTPRFLWVKFVHPRGEMCVSTGEIFSRDLGQATIFATPVSKNRPSQVAFISSFVLVHKLWWLLPKIHAYYRGSVFVGAIPSGLLDLVPFLNYEDMAVMIFLLQVINNAASAISSTCRSVGMVLNVRQIGWTDHI